MKVTKLIIPFWLKKLGVEQRPSLEHITIDSPKKIAEGELAGLYVCEVHLPIPDIEKKQHPVCSVNPIEALCLASEFAKVQLQFLINRGVYVISEAESREPWKLEKKDPRVYLQEKIEAIRNNKELSQEDKDKILGALKESFGKSPSPIKDQINQLI